MFDFPTSPTLDQTYTDGNNVYRYNGYAWAPITTAAPLDALAYNGMQINGSMDVSQEYGSVDQLGWLNFLGYTIDNWIINFVQATPGTTAVSTRQVVPPATPAFGSAITNCLRITATGAAPLAGATDRATVYQTIEGYRWSRLGFGSAAAQSVTVSFWVHSVKTGTACLLLGSQGTTPRCQIKTFTVSVANTWEYKTLTFSPDVATPANWLTTNGIGAYLVFTFGGGATTKAGTADVWANWTTQYATSALTNFFSSNNDAVHITGVVVVPGIYAPTAAQSPLIMRPFNQEMETCQRYYRSILTFAGAAFSATTIATNVEHPFMRVAPTITALNAVTITDIAFTNPVQSSANVTIGSNSADRGLYNLGNFTGLTAGRQYYLHADSALLVLAARL